MRRFRSMIPLLVLGIAACGGGGERVSIRGDFADTAAVPNTVVAVEAGQEAEVKRGAFALKDLGAGPVTLRLVRDRDTVATLALQNVPAGSQLQLHGLETDAPTRRAFPRSLGLNGPQVLVLNGIRMGREQALGDHVDTRGAVIAASDDRAALLVRPADALIPDLRVVVGLGTETIAADSTRIDAATIAPGDSLRVEGNVDQGLVVATRITVLGGRRAAATALRESPPPPAPADESAGDGTPPREPVRASAPAAERAPAVSVPVRVPGHVRRELGGGRGRGNGGGRGGGRGGGNGKGHGKKG